MNVARLVQREAAADEQLARAAEAQAELPAPLSPQEEYALRRLELLLDRCARRKVTRHYLLSAAQRIRGGHANIGRELMVLGDIEAELEVETPADPWETRHRPDTAHETASLLAGGDPLQGARALHAELIRRVAAPEIKIRMGERVVL